MFSKTDIYKVFLVKTKFYNITILNKKYTDNDTDRDNARTNRTQALTKSMNMDNRVIVSF